MHSQFGKLTQPCGIGRAVSELRPVGRQLCFPCRAETTGKEAAAENESYRIKLYLYVEFILCIAILRLLFSLFVKYERTLIASPAEKNHNAPFGDRWLRDWSRSRLQQQFGVAMRQAQIIPQEEKMQRFLQDHNIVLYRRLRNSSTGETERRQIFQLLGEQMDMLKMEFKRNKNEHQQDKLDKSVKLPRH